MEFIHSKENLKFKDQIISLINKPPHEKYFIFLLISTSIFAQSGENLELLFNWNDPTIVGTTAYNNAYNEVWGLVVNEREFAVIGSTSGTHIFDVTDPINTNKFSLFRAQSRNSNYSPRLSRQDGYLYAVSDEGNSTLQIIDIKQLPDARL